MKTKPTDEQVNAEIASLKALQPKVRPFSAFGDDHRAAIQAQIDVLEERMTLNDVYDRFGEDAFIDKDEFDQHALDSAISAADWLNGDLADDELPPAKDWEGLAS